MAVISLPAAVLPGYAGGLTWGQQRYELAGQSDIGGATQVRLMGPPRWTVSLRSSQAVDATEAAAWRTLLLQARGRVNHVPIYDINQPVPRGTLRGSPVLLNDLPAGSTSATIVGSVAGASAIGTWLQGDWLGFGSGVGTSQLVAVMADAQTVPSVSASGSVWKNGSGVTSVWKNGSGVASNWNTSGKITVTFEPPTRIAFPAGTAVVWNKPVAYFKQTTDSSSWSYYSTRVQQGYSFDGIEDWTP